MSPEELLAVWLADLDFKQTPYELLPDLRLRVGTSCFCTRRQLWQEYDAKDPPVLVIIHGHPDGEARRSFPAIIDPPTGLFRNRAEVWARIEAWLDEVHAYEEEVAS